MYVYRTVRFNEELTEYRDLSYRVDNFCSKLKEISFAEAQNGFRRLHSYIKRKEGNFRLIAKAIKVQKEPILCFLKVYHRGEPGYRHFLEDVKHRDFLFQESDLIPQLKIWLIAQQKQLPKIASATLHDDLRLWLERPNWQVDSQGIIIHESELWCRNFSQPKIRSQATVYHRIIEEIISQVGNSTFIGTETNWSDIRFFGREEFYVVYSYLSVEPEDRERVLLLITPILGVYSRDAVNKIIEPLFEKNLELSWWKKKHSLLLDDLVTYTKRSYPWYLISDENFWLRIQDGNGVNLALSVEEKALLHNVSTESSLPLFLNGRAGSGKSTMLFYLFAYYCHRHFQICQTRQQDFLATPHPLFITYSPNLANFARQKVRSILKHHHYFLGETDTLNNIPNLSEFFKSFRGFLLKLLPSSEKKKFAPENHVSFHRFKELFTNTNRYITPEKCWLVIQNFIKGYELIDKDSYLDSAERYQKIPKKERTVTVEEFLLIRDKVWHWYYNYTQQHALWDDRDLVRTILDLGCYQPQYTAIFCDEAQDFTRLELQLVMKLSVFSLYNLEKETIFSLPFAFAGDPLQTLNPTGFRWASFKAAFHDEVLTPLNLPEQSQVKLALQQLKYNYRSAAAIVRFNNLIQLWRKELFSFIDIKPQKAKKHNNFIPQKFIIDGNIRLVDLQQTLTDTIIIVPCNEGAEEDFIRNDELLSTLYLENSRTPWNILSAISAKGLEFKQVVLYRFGEACSLNFGKGKAIASEEDKYFLNKLYVAASRATEKLFIIDSLEGELKLWFHASDRKLLEKLLSCIDDLQQRQQWRENTELITTGNSLLDLGNNLESDALTFETNGINNQDKQLLLRAIAAYEKSQNTVKAEFCRAWKLKLERDFITAGKLFLALEHLVDAWDCFWDAMAWNELQKLIIETQDYHNRELKLLRSLNPVVNFMLQTASKRQLTTEKLVTHHILPITDFLTQELQQNNLTEQRDTQPWQIFLQQYCNQIQKLFERAKLLTSKQWLHIASLFTKYLDTNSTDVKQLIALCYYAGKNYRQAIHYWEDLDDVTSSVETEPAQYYIAKAKISKLPQSLEYLYRGKQYQIILKLWLKTGLTKEKAWLEYVAPTFEAIAHYHNALAIYCQLNNLEKAQQTWQQVKQHHPSAKHYKQIVKYYLRQQHWEEAIDLASNELPDLKLRCYFIYVLTNSQLTPAKLTKQQSQKYRQFVEQHILTNSLWQKYLTIKHLGIALEKIGSFVATLSFYEHYVNSKDRDIQQFSRDRWMVIKQSQIDYFRAGVQIAKLQKSQQKLQKNLKRWNSLSQSHDTAVTSVSLISQQRSPATSSFKISGLPHDTRCQILTSGIRQFQIGNFLLRIAKSIPHLAIIDLLSQKKVHLDWCRGKIQIDSTIFLISGDRPLSFSDTKSQYRAVLWRDANPRLELKLDRHQELIVIEFSDL